MRQFFDHRRVVYLLAFIIVVVVVSASTVILKPSLSGEVPIIRHSVDSPIETKPDKQTYKWYGAPDEPKYISLPTISAEGFVQKVSVDQNNQIATPNNVHIAAWFVKSAKPGQPGLGIIDGHVTGRVNDGIFKNLQSLKQGDQYSVTLGDGSVKKYQVMSVVTVPVAKSVDALFSQESNVPSQLNLITCGGTYDQKLKGYPDRVIVSARLL